MKIRVYYNVRKDKLSVQQKVNGKWKVTRYEDIVLMEGATFKVSESGRQRVLRDKRKNVHAFIEGEECPLIPVNCLYRDIVTYNPYRDETFVASYYGKPVDAAEYVRIVGKTISTFAASFKGEEL